MYISKVRIIGYRCFKDFKIELKPLTLVLGENNIGKSNLIEAIGLVLNKELFYFRKRSLNIEDFNVDLLGKFKHSVFEYISGSLNINDIEFPEVRIDLEMKEFTEEQYPIFTDWFVNDKYNVARISYIFSNHNPQKYSYLENLKDKCKHLGKEEILVQIDLQIDDYAYEIVGGVNDNKIDNYYYKMLKMEYLDAMRDSQRQLGNNNEKRLLYRILSSRKLDKYQDIKEKVKELDDILSNEQNELRSIKSDINEILNLLSLETQTTSNDVKFRFSSIEVDEILKKISLEYGSQPIGIERNGLGRNNLLYISTVLAFLNRKNEFFRIIGIEEPEAHLSPILQKHLAKNIGDRGNENNQIIITSHSSHIVNHIPLENTVMLFEDKSEIKSHYVLDSFSNTAADKNSIRYLKKWLNATQSTIFFTRRLILVEGISEMILIPKLFNIYVGGSLEKYNCQIINVNGVAFKHFLKLVNGGYFIRTIVLTDSDKGKSTENRADKLYDEFESNYISIYKTEKQDTFEKELIEFNNKGTGKNNVLKAMQMTRPIACDIEYIKSYKSKNLDIEDTFIKIEDYKSEFAMNFAECLKNNRSIKIPTYIIDAFDEIVRGE